MHILIFEVNLSGHHPIYLEKITEAYLELGHAVTVVVSEQYKDHVVITKLRNQFNHSFNTISLPVIECSHVMNSRWGDLGREIGLWRLFKKICRKLDETEKVDYVFLPYADYCLNAIGLLGSPFGNINWGGICMRPMFHFKACGVIAPTPVVRHVKRLLFKRVLSIKTLKNLFTIDELLAEYVRQYYPNLAAKLTYLPDPADPPLNHDVTGLRQQYGVPVGAKVVLVYGAINERKGFFKLLDVLEKSSQLEMWHVLIVGQQSQSVRQEFLSQRWDSLKQSRRIHLIDNFVTDELEHQVLAICDVVWVGYEGHYTMSGVIVRAGMYSKPIIACEEGLIGWYARYSGVGIEINKSIESIYRALNILSKVHDASMLGQNGWKQFNAHNWHSFIRLIVKNNY